MPANPCSGIKVEDSPSEEPVRVLSIAESKHLLELAQMELQATLKVGKTKMSVIKVYPGEPVPWFVLGLFAGLRPEETVRLDGADIDFDRRHGPPSFRQAFKKRRCLIPPEYPGWVLPFQGADRRLAGYERMRIDYYVLGNESRGLGLNNIEPRPSSKNELQSYG